MMESSFAALIHRLFTRFVRSKRLVLAWAVFRNRRALLTFSLQCKVRHRDKALPNLKRQQGAGNSGLRAGTHMILLNPQSVLVTLYRSWYTEVGLMLSRERD